MSTCVLTFHRVVDRTEKQHDISWPAFRALVQRLQEHEAASSTFLDDADEGRRLVLTFDDATADHLAVAKKVARVGMPAIFFVPAARIGAPGHLGDEELRYVHSLGHVIGAHSFHHAPLRDRTAEQLSGEVRRSKDALEQILGEQVRYFAPPGGIGHHLLEEQLTEAGFTASRSMRWGLYRSSVERWRIPCIPVTPATLGRGWVDRVVADWRLPLEMRSIGAVKDRLPVRARGPLRQVVGRLSRTGSANERR